MSNSDEMDGDRQIVFDIGREIFDAIRQKDVDSLGRHLADDFIYRTPDGAESGKAEFLRSIGEMPLDITSIKGEHLKVNRYDETVAVMTGVQRAGWRQGDDASGISSVAFTDVFILSEGRWLLALAYGVELPD
jgi:hypothetical protein